MIEDKLHFSLVVVAQGREFVREVWKKGHVSSTLYLVEYDSLSKYSCSSISDFFVKLCLVIVCLWLHRPFL